MSLSGQFDDIQAAHALLSADRVETQQLYYYRPWMYAPPLIQYLSFRMMHRNSISILSHDAGNTRTKVTSTTPASCLATIPIPVSQSNPSKGAVAPSGAGATSFPPFCAPQAPHCIDPSMRWMGRYLPEAVKSPNTARVFVQPNQTTARRIKIRPRTGARRRLT